MASLLFNHPMVTHEAWEDFTSVEHETWKYLFKRQSELLKNRASHEIIEGMNKLKICDNRIPKFSELNEILEKESNFTIVPVKGLIPRELFFQFLSERKFPSTCFIRKQNQLDYLEEPDIFHDVFGHIPLLVHSIFSNFMQEFGRKGLEASEYNLQKFAARLYWFTVEFGLIHTSSGLRIYGSGITSSKGESAYALDSKEPVRLKFDIRRAMKTQYHIDSFQKTYFVVESFESLFQALRDLKWSEVKETCQFFPEIEQGVFINKGEKILSQ